MCAQEHRLGVEEFKAEVMPRSRRNLMVTMAPSCAASGLSKGRRKQKLGECKSRGINEEGRSCYYYCFCTYSRKTSSFLMFLTVSYGLLLGLSTVATSQISDADATGRAAQQRAHASSSYLLYSASSPSSSSSTTDRENNKMNDGQQQQQQGTNNLEELLKDKNHSHASDRIDLTLANRVWLKMHQQVESYAKSRTELLRPSLDELMSRASVSSTCRQSILDTIDHLAKLDDWAVRMYNSFGNFPAAGFFEGTHTSMGSYHQCVNVDPNEWIGRAQYCTLQFQPIIPKRPRYHNILATIDQLANFTTKNDIFHGLAKKAHYFYYTKLRLATCMPTKCEKNDLEQLGEQIAVNTFLQYQGVQCLERSGGFAPDGAQVFALTVLLLMASVSLLGTLVHLFDLRSYLSNQAINRLHLHHQIDLKSSYNAKTTFDQALAVQQQQKLLLGSANRVTHLGHHTHHHHHQDLHHHNHHNHHHHHHHHHSLLSQKAPILPTGPVIQLSENNNNKIAIDAPLPTGQPIACCSSNERLLAVINVLMHFSIIRNGKKLFDTSTSRRRPRAQSRAASSLVPGMREPVAVGVVISDGSSSGSVASSSAASTTGSQSDDSPTGGAGNSGQSNDISCVHGLRFWTISWIILGHTMQYTEWAGFGRAYQVEENITSFLLHPLLNATFSVDTFFLISGLLTTYVTWSITRGQYWRFNKFAFLISRYLRLMPQVLIVILLFIVFPMMGDGPYWRGMIQKESDNCKRNWWVSALFLQSFYRSDQICNLVTWWLSIEMFYHFVSIIVIIALLHSSKKGIMAALTVGGSLTAYSCYLHYSNSYPPNMLPTLLQRYEIWDSIVLKYFWTPYPHAPSYFVGLMLGYVLYNRSIRQLSKRQVRYGWIAFAVCYLSILFGTYHWNNNAPYSRLVSTTYYNASQILWSFATGWAILACALGHGGWLNDFLSSPVFVPLGRATYMTYLSHMLIVMAYPAKQNLLIEPSYIVFLYIFIANLCLSYMLGIALTLVFESPILHLQKLLVTGMASKFNGEEPAGGGGGGSKSSSRNRRPKTNTPGQNGKASAAAAAAVVVVGDESDSVRASLYAHEADFEMPTKVVPGDEEAPLAGVQVPAS